MPRVFLLFTFLFGSMLALFSQGIVVLDKATSKPIANVLIYTPDNDNHTQTDKFGKTSLTKFDNDALLIFQHQSYQDFNIQLVKLKSINHTILLEKRVFKYNEVIISANKWDQGATEIPQEILSLSSKDIQYGSPQTSADVLKNSGQVFVQKSQLGGGSPTLRGFAANRILIVVDGVRMNNAIFRSGNLQNIINIDPNALESAEVVFGPGSVIYGSDALGGVMNFQTLKSTFSKKDELKINGVAMTRFSSANNEQTGHLNFRIGSKKMAFVSTFSYSDFDDLKTGTNFDNEYPTFGKRLIYADRIQGIDTILQNSNQSLQKFSRYRQWSAINKLKYQLNKNVEFSYGFYFANTSNIPRYDRLIRPNGLSLREAEWYYGPQKWNMHHLQMNLYKPSSFYDEAKIITTYQLFEESRHDRDFGSDDLRNQKEKVDLFTLNLDLNKALGNSNLYYGVEYTYNNVNSQADILDISSNSITPTSSRYPNGGSKYSSIAGYTTYKWFITDKLVINAGVRFSRIALSGNSTNLDAQRLNFDKFNLKNSALNGNIGMVYNPSDKTKLSFAMSTGFRSPNIDDVGKVFEIDNEGMNQIVIVPNSDLKPEYSYNIESGIDQKINDYVKANIVLYGTFLDDAIVRGPITINGQNTAIINGTLSKLRAQVNTNQAYIYGGSANVKITLPYNFTLNSSYTITKGKDKTNDQPLRHTTPNFGKTTITYKKGELRSSFYIEYNGNKFRSDIPATEIEDKSYLYAIHTDDSSKDGSPGWYTINMKFSYNITKNISLLAALENILDKHYRPYSSGISAPSKSLTVSIIGRL